MTEKMTWVQPEVKGHVPRGRSNAASAVVGTRLYVYGGTIGNGKTTPYQILDDFECFDLGTPFYTPQHQTCPVVIVVSSMIT